MNETDTLSEVLTSAGGNPSEPFSRQSETSKRAVVVLGMPRSGTSLLTSLLQGLGVRLGEKLSVADPNNPAGYWEHEEICHAQEDILKLLGRRWIDQTGTNLFPAGWTELPEIKPFKARLMAIVDSELSRNEGLWGFKDPRTSRLLPLWKEIFAEMQVAPVYLLALREPASAVQSMVKLYGISAARTELLWLLHNLDAVRDAGDQLRAVVDYDRWFTHPREQAQAVARALEIEWPADDKQLLAAFKERIRPDLRHCRATHPSTLPFISETCGALKAAAAHGHIPSRLDALDREVRRAMALCEPWRSFVEETTRPRAGAYSFIEHFSEARVEQLGPEGHADIWDALIDGPMHRALFLHPPARLHFHVPDGRRARLTFAVNIHPHAWRKPNAGGCEFNVTVDQTLSLVTRVDPVNVASDRRWHECTLDIPENTAGCHEVVFETQPWGKSLDFRWAVWRDPRLTWVEDEPPLSPAIFGQPESARIVSTQESAPSA